MFLMENLFPPDFWFVSEGLVSEVYIGLQCPSVSGRRYMENSDLFCEEDNLLFSKVVRTHSLEFNVVWFGWYDMDDQWEGLRSNFVGIEISIP